MTEEKQHKRDWVDITLKLLTPVFAGILIALAGAVGNMMLSKQESARLITELQIRREQADSELRKDVFDQALGAFLLKNQDYAGTLKDMSKQLLRLELLALNFGDSLSLSPLFTEFRNDLQRSKPVNEEERVDYEERKAELQKRLVALAKRVASAQLSSLAQHGKTKVIPIALYEYKQLSEKEDDRCKKNLFEDRDFAWPDNDVLQKMGVLNDAYQLVKNDETISELKQDGVLDGSYEPFVDYARVAEVKDSDLFKELAQEESQIELNGVKRYLLLNIADVDHCKETAKVQLRLYKDDPENPEVDRTFTLDYFNFPMVDNTRLSDNQRLAIVVADFNLDGNDPKLNITGIIFPSEYASLRDRPGMQEARKLLESALKKGDNIDD